ncbi:MAG: LuxR C-terminal-related transcriptional regulator [Flavobacteriaceae bacterium]
MIKLIYIDNHSISRKGFKSIFKKSREIEIIGSFKDFDRAKETLNKKIAEIVIITINQKYLNSVYLIKKIMKIDSSINLLVFGDYNHNNKIKYIKSGAKGFISKEAGIRELKNAIYNLVVGKFYNSEYKKINSNKSKNTVSKKQKNLSKREKEVLKYLFKGERNKLIADRLKINPKTVNTYKTRALSKLRVKELINAYALINSED